MSNQLVILPPATLHLFLTTFWEHLPVDLISVSTFNFFSQNPVQISLYLNLQKPDRPATKSTDRFWFVLKKVELIKYE